MRGFLIYRLSLLLIGVISVGFASNAAAQLYVGGALGQTDYRDAEEFGVDDDSTAFEAKVGFRALDVLAFEASFLTLGDVWDYTIDADVNVSGLTLSGKALLPIGPQMDLYAKMGIYIWEMDEIYRNRSYYLDEGEDLIYGGGAVFHLTEQVDLDLEYRAMDLYDMSTSLITVGVSFVF